MNISKLLIGGTKNTEQVPDQYDRLWLNPINQPLGSKNIVDLTGRSTLTLLGDTQISNDSPEPGIQSIYFDGAGDFIVAPYNTVGSILSGDFEVSFWMKPTVTDATRVQVLVGQWLQSNGRGGFLFGYVNSSIVFGFGPISEGSYPLQVSAIILNSWNAVKVTRVGNLFTLTVNQTSATTSSNAEKSQILINYVMGDYYSSQGIIGTPLSVNYQGYLANIRIKSFK